MAQKQISLMRATPPYLPEVSQALRKTWISMAESDEDLVWDLRQVHYDREENHSAGLEWIGNRIRPAPIMHRVLATDGTINAILLLLSSIVPPGNVLLTEELTVPQVYAISRIASVEVKRVRIDQQGLVPDDFEQKCKQHAPKAVYVNCTVHNPTAYVTPVERRRAIAEIARRYCVQIIEDESQALYVDHLPDSFATIAPDITWYLMGLSKYLSLDVRMAFIVAPERRLPDNLVRLRQALTWHPEPVMASIVTRWIRSGVARNLFNSVRTEVGKRQAIVSELLSDIEGFRGSSGLHFWLPAPAGLDSEQFTRMISEAGILVQPSKVYADGSGARLEGIRPSVGDPVDFTQIRYAVEVIRDIYYLLWFGSVP